MDINLKKAAATLAGALLVVTALPSCKERSDVARHAEVNSGIKALPEVPGANATIDLSKFRVTKSLEKDGSVAEFLDPSTLSKLDSFGLPFGFIERNGKLLLPKSGDRMAQKGDKLIIPDQMLEFLSKVSTEQIIDLSKNPQRAESYAAEVFTYNLRILNAYSVPHAQRSEQSESLANKVIEKNLGGFVSYKIKPGDTIRGIAERLLQSVNSVGVEKTDGMLANRKISKLIINANLIEVLENQGDRSDSVAQIKPGQIIKLPKKMNFPDINTVNEVISLEVLEAIRGKALTK